MEAGQKSSQLLCCAVTLEENNLRRGAGHTEVQRTLRCSAH
jgi:hypothetical protein